MPDILLNNSDISAQNKSPLLRHRWLPVLAAALLTFVTLVCLSLISKLQSEPEKQLRLRKVDAIVLHSESPPASDVPPPPNTAEKSAPPAESPVPPPLSPPRRQTRPSVKPSDIKLNLSNAPPDFSLNTQLSFDRASPTLSPPVSPPAASPGGGPFGLAQLDKAPTPIMQSPPFYPFSARSRGIEGYVKVRFVVTPEGNVQNLKVLNSSPPGIFNEVARQAVEKWQFEAGEKNGEPVYALMELKIRFELED
ncbi:MAG: energy transducer TonB [Lentisphaeria bacterium]